MMYNMLHSTAKSYLSQPTYQPSQPTYQTNPLHPEYPAPVIL